MKPGKKMLAVIFGIITAFLLIAVFGIGEDIKGVQEMRYGIDVSGGVEAIFEPQNLDRTATSRSFPWQGRCWRCVWTPKTLRTER